jgi:hypothetical protein
LSLGIRSFRNKAPLKLVFYIIYAYLIDNEGE